MRKDDKNFTLLTEHGYLMGIHSPLKTTTNLDEAIKISSLEVPAYQCIAGQLARRLQICKVEVVPVDGMQLIPITQPKIDAALVECMTSMKPNIINAFCIPEELLKPDTSHLTKFVDISQNQLMLNPPGHYDLTNRSNI